MTQLFHQTAKIALILIYLVILAGAVVRMTGSGMGCPDWPKCFGYYIPPTEASALQFKPDHHYSKGHIIILNDSLWVAKKDFTSSESISLEQWSPYTTHDYATYNPLHTWIEYINRLLGALSGLPILLLAFLSLKRWKINRWNTVVGILTLIGIGFQAWLGKTSATTQQSPRPYAPTFVATGNCPQLENSGHTTNSSPSGIQPSATEPNPRASWPRSHAPACAPEQYLSETSPRSSQRSHTPPP